MIPAELQPVKLPFALFFGAQDFGDKITLSSRLRDGADGLLDGESLILPVPQNGPPEVPRIQLQSRDGAWMLQVGANRLVWEWNRRAPDAGSWGMLSAAYLKALGGMLRVFAGEYARPVRFAYQPQFILPTKIGANAWLAENVLRPGRVIGAPHTIKLSVLDQSPIAGRPMNLWLNIATARDRDQPDNDLALVVQFDLNSIRDDPKTIPADEMMDVMMQAEGAMARQARAALQGLLGAED